MEISRNFLVAIVIIQFMTNVTVVLNIMIARQVIGFLYLTFIPGVVLLRILKLDKLNIAEIILFSAGLSIAFLMFTGLLINELGPLIGISKPLSLAPLMIILNGVILLSCFLSYLKDKNFRFPLAESIKLSPSTLLLFFIPLLSVIGVLLVNTFPRNNSILLLMIITISALVFLGTLSKKLLPPKYYPLALIIIAIALLFHASLISNHINGFDIQIEYYVFKLTEKNSYWSSAISYTNLAYARTNAMLSVTVLPTIYLNILNMEGTWILKIIYPLIFSFVPLGLYQLYKTRVGKKVAFMSTFFFMANFAFFTEMIGLAKQMVAELFYILLFLVLLNKKIKPVKKTICFIIFSTALVVSHYSTAYIFMFLIFFAMLSLFFLKNKTRSITAGLVVLFFVIQFAWYIYVSGSGPFNEFISYVNFMFRNLFTNFFNPGSRGASVLKGVGMTSTVSFGHLMGRIFAYATEFFIIIGFITSLTKRKKFIVNQEYMVISSLNMALLAMCILVPFFARGLNMARFYHIQLFFLAPFCILGGETFFELISNKKIKSYLPVLIVLIPFFLYQTEFVYELTGDDSWSIPLSKYRMDAQRQRELAVLSELDVVGAEWLSKYVDVGRIPVYADHPATYSVLGGGYGMIYRDTINLLDNNTIVLPGGVIYLRWINTFGGVISVGRKQWNITEISFIPYANRIYSNGGCVIYKNLPYNITSLPL